MFERNRLVPPWAQGTARIDQLLQTGDLQRIQGTATDGAPMLDKARRTLASAAILRPDDPDNSYTLAYDAARFACTALLAQQGLRPTTRGGHYAVEQAVRAQFGDGFRGFGTLRRRRNELEYPAVQGETTSDADAVEAYAQALAIIDAAARLLGHLDFF
jgi:hypothetical protein